MSLLVALSLLVSGESPTSGASSPALLHRIQSSRHEAAYALVRYDAKEDAGDAEGFRTHYSYARKASPSAYWGLEAALFRDASDENQRGLTAATLRGAYKVLDKVVVALAVGRREGENESKAVMPVVQPALLVKSEWYELAYAQRAVGVVQDFGGGDERRTWYHERTYLARSFPSQETAFSLQYQRNPLAECCFARDSEQALVALSVMSGPFEVAALHLTKTDDDEPANGGKVVGRVEATPGLGLVSHASYLKAEDATRLELGLAVDVGL